MILKQDLSSQVREIVESVRRFIINHKLISWVERWFDVQCVCHRNSNLKLGQMSSFITYLSRNVII